MCQSNTLRAPLQNTWYGRLFLVFAAVELYVLEMPRYEDQLDGEGDTAYPCLVLSGDPIPLGTHPPLYLEGRPILTLTIDQLHTRLAAPGSNADRFDHPLLFVRSDIAWEAKGPGGQLRRGGDVRKRRASALEDDCSIIPYTQEPPAVSTATVKGILGLAGTVLSHTALLRKLSLTGFLERAVCGGYASRTLESLRCLSIGPPPSRWSWLNALHLSEVALGNLHRLRLCGHLLRKDQAAAVVGAYTKAKLREFQWSYTELIGSTKMDRGSQWVSALSSSRLCRDADWSRRLTPTASTTSLAFSPDATSL